MVFEKTFSPALIIAAFKKCGIYPLDPSAVKYDVVKAGEENNQAADAKETEAEETKQDADVSGTAEVTKSEDRHESIELSTDPREPSDHSSSNLLMDCTEDGEYSVNHAPVKLEDNA